MPSQAVYNSVISRLRSGEISEELARRVLELDGYNPEQIEQAFADAGQEVEPGTGSLSTTRQETGAETAARFSNRIPRVQGGPSASRRAAMAQTAEGAATLPSSISQVIEGAEYELPGVGTVTFRNVVGDRAQLYVNGQQVANISTLTLPSGKPIIGFSYGSTNGGTNTNDLRQAIGQIVGHIGSDTTGGTGGGPTSGAPGFIGPGGGNGGGPGGGPGSGGGVNVPTPSPTGPTTFEDFRAETNLPILAREFALGTGISSRFRPFAERAASRQLLPFLVSQSAGGLTEGEESAQAFRDFLNNAQTTKGRFGSNPLSALSSSLDILSGTGTGIADLAQREAIEGLLFNPESLNPFSSLIGNVGQGFAGRLPGTRGSAAIQNVLTNMVAQNPFQFENPRDFLQYLRNQGILG